MIRYLSLATSGRCVVRPVLRFLALALLVPAFASPAVAAAQTFVVRGVTLIDGTGAPPLPDAVVVVKDGRIAAVGPASSTTVPGDATTIDGGGRTLLPGFVDTHAHLTVGPVTAEVVDGQPRVVMKTLDDGARRSLLLLLAHGVTTIRDPGGDTEHLVATRDALERGELVGPRAVVAGRVIDTADFPGLVDRATTAAEVRVAVRRQAEAGVDLVKLYTTLGPDLVAAGVEEAHRLGLPAVAHLHETTWAEAAELGLDGIVHIIPGTAELLPVPAREGYATKPGALGFPHWFDLVDLDAQAVRTTVHTLAAEGVHLDPTLVVFEHAFFGDVVRFTSETAALSLAHPELVENWRSFFSFNLGWTERDFEVAHRVWPKVLAFTRQLWEGGVLLSAGTDANNPWTVPGVSFHRELQLLAAAGIPPGEVLKIGTRNGAEVAGLLDETGTVEPGKRADLVLVDGDPWVDLRATERIVWVMKDGRRYDPEELLARLD